MAQRLISAAGTVAILWILGMATIAVIAVTLEGEVSGGALGGIVTTAMPASAIVAFTGHPCVPDGTTAVGVSPGGDNRCHGGDPDRTRLGA